MTQVTTDRGGQIVWVALCVALEVLIAAIAVSLDRQVLISALALPPIVCSLRAGTAATIGVGLLSLAGAIALGFIEGTPGGVPQIVRLGIVVTGAVLSVMVAELRDRLQTAERQVRASEQRLLVGLQNSPVSLARQDRRLRYTWTFNPGGIQPDDILGKTDSETLPADVAGALTAIKKRVLERAEGIREEIVWSDKTGIRCHDVSCEPLRDESGAVSGVTTAAIDVTARKLAESALRASQEQYEAIVETANEGMFTTDAQASINFANGELVDITRIGSVEAIVGRNAFEFAFEDDHEVLMERFLACVAGEPQRFDARFKRVDGTEFWGSIGASPLTDDRGEVVGTLCMLTDITERKEQEQALAAMLARERFLVEAGVALDKALTIEDTLDQVAHLAVPVLGSSCMIDVVDERGGISTSAAAALDPSVEATMRTIRSRFPLTVNGPHPVSRAIRTGEAQTGLITAEEIAKASPDAEHQRLLSEREASAYLAVPLRSRSRVIGVALLAKDGGEFSEDEIYLAKELAKRAGLSIENARLYERERSIAQTLQQSLVPEELPEVPAFEVASTFLPATGTTDVGGDSYDLFEDRGGAHVAMIVDVCGKGAEAAALTSMVRYTIRSLGLQELDPEDLLGILNDTIIASDAQRYCTAVVARLSNANGGGANVTMSVGGHPPPLLVSSETGAVREVGPSGPLVGVFDDAMFKTQTVALERGDTLVLYTDGVTDALGRGQRIERGQLQDHLSTNHRASVGEIATALAHFARGGHDESVLHDDVTALVIRSV